jgi:hypothetical protein
MYIVAAIFCVLLFIGGIIGAYEIHNAISVDSKEPFLWDEFPNEGQTLES